VHSIAVPFTSHRKLCNNAEPKPFSSAKPAYFDFSSSNFAVWNHILSTAGDALTTQEQGSSGSKHQPEADRRSAYFWNSGSLRALLSFKINKILKIKFPMILDGYPVRTIWVSWENKTTKYILKHRMPMSKGVSFSKLTTQDFAHRKSNSK
jgi:hypothetical protein